MPSPLVTAAYRYVMASGLPQQLIAANLLGYDPVGGAFTTGWVFSGESDGNPYRDVEGSGRCAIVIYSYDEWTIPANFRSTQYPRLHLTVFADVSRDADGQPVNHDAEDKAFAVWRKVHPLFHDAGNRIHAFDSLRIINTVQGGTWNVMEVPDGDGSVRGDIVYNCQVD